MSIVPRESMHQLKALTSASSALEVPMHVCVVSIVFGGVVDVRIGVFVWTPAKLAVVLQ